MLACMGLGSCIGVVLYDPLKKIGGVAHVMLPESCQARKRGAIDPTQSGKFADTAIREMLKEMVSMGADKKRIEAKIFGGANMFSAVHSQTMLLVGERNVQAVSQELEVQKINLLARDVGGTVGRTIIFDTETGQVVVRTLKEKERVW